MLGVGSLLLPHHNAARRQVYDITEWLGKHPGGSKPLLRVIGRDATPTFDMVHKGVDPDEALPVRRDTVCADALALS